MVNGKDGKMRFKVQSLWLMLLLLLTTGVVHAQVTTSAVYQNGSGSLILCNNLILNNETDTETNVSSVPTSNILGGDFYNFFENLTTKYDIMVGTPAHNAGDNQCVDWDRDLKGEDFHVVAVIGDGAMTGGMAYEALNHIGDTRRRLIIVQLRLRLVFVLVAITVHALLKRLRISIKNFLLVKKCCFFRLFKLMLNF